MGNIVIARPDLSDVAVITAGSAGTSTPVSNLQRKQPTDVWQTTSLLSTYFVVDLGSAQLINLIALLFTNASSIASWRIRMAASEGALYASPSYDGPLLNYMLTESGDYIDTESGDRLLNEYPGGPLWASNTLESRRHGLAWLTTPISARWIRIDITDITNPDGVFRAGRLYISNAWQPTVNAQVGLNYGWEDGSQITPTFGHNLIPDSKPTAPFVNFAIKFLSEDEMLTNSYEIDRVRGAAKDVLVITNPDIGPHLHKHIYYGLLSNGRKINAHEYNQYELAYSLKGMI